MEILVQKELLEALALKVTRVPKETSAQRDSRASEELRDQLDEPEFKVLQVLLDRLGVLDNLEFQVSRVQVELQEKVVCLDCLAFREQEDETAYLAFQATMDVQEILGHRVLMVQRETPVGRVCQDPQGVWEVLASTENRVLRVNLD